MLSSIAMVEQTTYTNITLKTLTWFNLADDYRNHITSFIMGIIYKENRSIWQVFISLFSSLPEKRDVGSLVAHWLGRSTRGCEFTVSKPSLLCAIGNAHPMVIKISLSVYVPPCARTSRSWDSSISSHYYPKLQESNSPEFSTQLCKGVGIALRFPYKKEKLVGVSYLGSLVMGYPEHKVSNYCPESVVCRGRQDLVCQVDNQV